ncbi:MAG TPA: hypothetical protein VKE41_06290 [Roseiflexaceae bacterium]|nr:hypothetical protein [Roseiflexaceae bacterium]
MNPNPTLEVVLFKLQPGVEEAAFLQINQSILTDLRAMSGFIRRDLFKDSHGQWMDIVYWSSLAEAQRAAEIFPSLPCAQSLMEMLDGTSLTMLHLEQAGSYV